jgi:mannose-6-phosphate isomerase-like protein (cupin superfamily)
MINWAILKKGRRFEPHYHEDMDEVFIILSGKVEIKVGREINTLEKGEGIVVSMRSIHTMKNLSDEDVEYLAIGFTLGKNGKTVNVQEIA